MSSLECTLTGDKEKKAKKEIQAKFNRLYSYYDIDNDKKMLQLAKKRRKRNFKRLGFKKVENLKDIEVNDCLALSYVPLDQLRNYKAGESDPESLLNTSHTYVFQLPDSNFEVKILKNNEKDDSENFPTIQVGPSDGFKSLFEAKFTGCSDRCFGVYINGLQQYLLGDFISGEFKLQIPGNSMGGQSLKKGEFLPADVVFKELSMEARKNKYEWPPWPFGQPGTRPRPQP
jgi:hypothetical protein